MIEVFILLVGFQIKHWVCDYPLQNRYMLGKFKKEGWVLPLTSHAAVHMLGTLAVISIYLAGNFTLAVILAIMDGVIHFIVDRVKASPRLGGRFNIDQPQFWWVLGVDQMAHHLTHYAIIAVIVLW